jgi:prepilin-type N-terminal cleavage/methylation domain-containing protein
MAFLKKGFTLIEVTVVLSVIAILSTMTVFGLKKAGQGEAQKADYLKFYEDVKSLKMRANLGKQNSDFSSSIQILRFNIGDSSYSLNGVNVPFKNRSLFQSVVIGPNTYNTKDLDVTIRFYPSNFSDELPTSYGTIGGATAFSGFTTINIVDYTGNSKPISLRISGVGYLINTINTLY